MLSKKLVKKMFFAPRLLLMVTIAIVHPAIGYSSPHIPAPGNLALLHDTTKEGTSDSVAAKITLNKNVVGFVNAYVKKEDEFLQKMRGKSCLYFPAIEKVFEQYEVPHQLKYLAIVESELQPAAKSRVGARGLWQLMPGTARELGLKVSGKNDERLHTSQSTVAAAKYLKRLYACFGDWLLVLAAYNSGPGTVLKAIKGSHSRNFWALQKFLPAESRGHIKRFISIHYFFEAEGSIATQTAAEANLTPPSPAKPERETQRTHTGLSNDSSNVPPCYYRK